ncbi:MAG: VWA domain-containing protein [Sphingomonadaceae bacterium]
MKKATKFAIAVATIASVAGCASGDEAIEEGAVQTDSAGVYSPPPPPPAMMAERAAMAVSPVIVPMEADRERYDGEEVSPVKRVADEPVSTFAVDVDTGAYANTRRYLRDGRRPPKAAVRTEEFVNYFRYDYAKPQDRSTPFSVATAVARTPWNEDTRLLRIGLQGYDLPRDQRPAANLVFLLDVSGSMNSPDKLPLLKTALKGLVDNLREEDRVSIVVYAGAAGLVLDPTNDPREIKAALDQLSAGGSTAGGAGLQLAYQTARANFIEGGVNRVIIGTDGDFNVGISDPDALVERIEKERDTGVTLSVLGFGSGNYNEALMEQIANKGNGNYSYIDSALEARKVLGEEMSSTLFTIAKDVKIQVEFNPKFVKQYRLIGYENRALREQDFDNDRVDAGEIGASHQVTALYEVVPASKTGWIGERRYDGNKAESTGSGTEMAYIKLRYKLPDGDRSTLVERAVPAAMLDRAGRAQGDFAFAAGVAAFGQYLRGDELLNGFGPRQIVSLVGPQRDFYRAEFVKLVEASAGMD